VHHVAFPKPDWGGGGWGRIHRYCVPAAPLPVRAAAAVHARSGLKRRYPKDVRPFGGAQFWALARDAAQLVVEVAESRPDLVRAYRWTFAPDEMLIQTIIGSFGRSLPAPVNDAINFLEWERPGKVLVSSDMPSLRTTYHCFARKFDVRVDGNVLNMIDSELL
jgi:hypothetical protein